MIMQSAQDREEAIAVGRHAVRLAFLVTLALWRLFVATAIILMLVFDRSTFGKCCKPGKKVPIRMDQSGTQWNNG